jgi:mannose-1-phosphate guanylyltransferase
MLSAVKSVMPSSALGHPGNLYSLKEALQGSAEATVQRGNVVHVQTKDSLIFNLSGDKVVAAMGLEGLVVVDTPEVLLVVHKDSVRHLGKLLEELAAKGYEHLL